ncbi:ABC transporter permease [Arthrobacter cupressi]|uniref:Putative aldouronate transport system permease protein n=1 Tax=Arthrobacter cupressi TaxID=1045773 RepID=A0A1G8J803_9MICC|nr:ABC transporter permease subunit [Arthrobacter cupressi]NYD79248.1 putative aldouronate transport system permease protein [Arthrobacter cupressi]SDI26770.1 putative aldouronate transport system permease protein [Arthrobacter cupressi]
MNSTTEAAPALPDADRVPAHAEGRVPGRGKGKPGKGKPGRATRSKPRDQHKQSFGSRLRRDKQMLLMMVPGIAFLLLFFYIPILGNVIAFQDYQPYLGIGDSMWVGWQNFVDLFANPDFLRAFWNTLYLAAWQLVFLFPVPLVLALIVDSLISTRVRRVFQSIAYLPHFLSWVLVIALFQQMLGGAGFINNSLRQFGLDPIPFMTNPDTFPVLVVVQMIWKDAGWAMIIFLAALASIDASLYEAAAADGAGRWRRMWHITLPGLRSVIVLLLILRIGDILSVGFEQFILQRDAVGAGAAEVLDTFTYYTGVVGGGWSSGAAAGLAKGVVSALLIYAANKLAHRFGEDGIFAKKVG